MSLQGIQFKYFHLSANGFFIVLPLKDNKSYLFAFLDLREGMFNDQEIQMFIFQF